MMNRCYTSSNKDYPNVGGKGIRVQESWHKYESFLQDMGEKPDNAILKRYVDSMDFTVDNTYWMQKIDTRTNRLYGIWKGIKRRTGNMGSAADKASASYSARQITMCPDWIDSFASFAAAVGAPPSENHQLDRADNNHGYWPGNVRWVEAKENANNRSDNVVIEMYGERKTLQEWCEHYGVDRQTVSTRWATLFTQARAKNQRVQQLGLDGAVIKEFAGAKEAANATGILQGTIAKCLSGGNATAGGFCWRYVTE